MTELYESDLADTEATEALGAAIANCFVPGSLIHLLGELGAGKTTLVRGFLRGLGYTGAVKSPTYTLVENYMIREQSVYHFDLYRLGDPEELEYMGIRDYLDELSVSLVEWPQRGEGILPTPDLEVSLEYRNDGRRVQISATSARGKAVIDCLNQ